MDQSRRSSWFCRWLLPAIGFGSGTALLAQAISPFHVLTHEFTQTFALSGSVVVYLLGRAIARRLPDDGSLALQWTLAVGLIMGLATFAVQIVANAVAHDCRIGSASAFFWITWAPLVAFCAVLGVVIGGRRWSLGAALMLAAGIGIASLAHDIVQFVVGVGGVDPFLGELRLLSQRAGMEVTTQQFGQRLWLVGLAVVVWQLHTWYSRREAATAARTILAAAAFAALTLGAGSEIGVGWSRRAIRLRLDGVHETEHFRIRYNGMGRSSLRVAAIGREAEWQWHTLTTAWGVEPDYLIEIQVYDDQNQMRQLTGSRNAHAGIRRIGLLAANSRPSTLRHEMVHVLHPELSWNPRLLFLRGHAEGAAVAWAEDLVRLPEAHARQAAALEAGRLPAAGQVMGLAGFSGVSESNAYQAAGSFIGWLVLEYGFDRFVRLEQDIDYEAAYGRDLNALDAEWRRFLATVPVSLTETAEVRESLSPEVAPSYRGRSCPKLGPRHESGQERAERLFAARNYSGAVASYTRLYEEEGRPASLVSAATCLQELGRDAEALALLSEAKNDVSEADQRHEFLEARIRSLIALHDWDGLYAALDARRALGAPSADQEQIEECLRHTEVRDDVARALVPGEAPESQEILRGLSARHPERRCVRYLAATRGHPIPQDRWSPSMRPFERERIDMALAALKDVPEACGQMAPRLRTVVEKSIDVEAWDVADRVVTLVGRTCTNPLDRAWAAQAVERLAWERRGAVVPSVPY